MNKKLLSISLLGVSLLGLTACGDNKTDQSSNSKESVEKSVDSSSTEPTKEKELKEVQTYDSSDSPKMTKYREEVAQLSNGEQVRRLKMDVLPKLEENNHKYVMQGKPFYNDEHKLQKTEQVIYSYPKNDQSDWKKVAIVYTNPDLPKKSQVSFKVLDKEKTPKLYATLSNNIR